MIVARPRDEEKMYRECLVRVTKIVQTVTGLPQDKAMKIARNAVVR